MMNSFVLLQQQDEEVFVSKYEEDVRRTVESRLRTVHFISDVFGHFFPMLSDTMTVLAGGSVIDPEDAYLTLKDDEQPSDQPPRPGTPDGDGMIR